MIKETANLKCKKRIDYGYMSGSQLIKVLVFKALSCLPYSTVL